MCPELAGDSARSGGAKEKVGRGTVMWKWARSLPLLGWNASTFECRGGSYDGGTNAVKSRSNFVAFIILINLHTRGSQPREVLDLK